MLRTPLLLSVVTQFIRFRTIIIIISGGQRCGSRGCLTCPTIVQDNKGLCVNGRILSPGIQLNCKSSRGGGNPSKPPQNYTDNPITLLGHLGHCFGALGALVWGTWGTRLGHLGHSSGALGALVWGTWGTRLGHLRKFFEVLEVPTMQLRHLFAITHLLGKAEALQ